MGPSVCAWSTHRGAALQRNSKRRRHHHYPGGPQGTAEKDFSQIMEAHNPAYLATACSSYPGDLYNKFVKAKSITGTRFVHLFIPCPAGWGYPTKDTVKIGRLAVESAVVVLYEIDHGVFRLTGKSLSMARSNRKRPVEEYLELQGLFKRMTAEQLADFQRHVDQRWEVLVNRAGRLGEER